MTRSGQKCGRMAEIARSRVPTSHCQTTITRHPISASRAEFDASRRTLPSNLFIENSAFDFRMVVSLQPGCRCQKQPFTKTTVFYFGSTSSGRPGIPWRSREVSVVERSGQDSIPPGAILEVRAQPPTKGPQVTEILSWTPVRPQQEQPRSSRPERPDYSGPTEPRSRNSAG
jgi:hypothetical protein